MLRLEFPKNTVLQLFSPSLLMLPSSSLDQKMTVYTESAKILILIGEKKPKAELLVRCFLVWPSSL